MTLSHEAAKYLLTQLDSYGPLPPELGEAFVVVDISHKYSNVSYVVDHKDLLCLPYQSWIMDSVRLGRTVIK